jgi:hypothetical protein
MTDTPRYHPATPNQIRTRPVVRHDKPLDRGPGADPQPRSSCNPYALEQCMSDFLEILALLAVVALGIFAVVAVITFPIALAVRWVMS